MDILLASRSCSIDIRRAEKIAYCNPKQWKKDGMISLIAFLHPFPYHYSFNSQDIAKES